MTHRRLLPFMACCLMIAISASLPPLPPTAAQGPAPAAPTLTKDTVSTIIQKNEWPRVALSATQVHVTWKSGVPKNSITAYSERAEAGTTWPSQQSIGGGGNGSYNTASVAVSPVDNSVHLVWSDTSQGGDGYMFYSRLQSGGQWTTPVRISQVGQFAHYPHATVDSLGHIWALWSAENPRGSFAKVYYRYSTDNGATWQPGTEGVVDSPSGFAAESPWIAADKQGGVHAVWYRKDGTLYYGRWTGSTWANQSIPAGGYNAEPSVTVDPSNNLHIAWRRNRAFGAWDVYYATKTLNASTWNIQKLYSGGNVNKSVPIFADEQGTLHLAWYDDLGGSNIWYTYKPAGGAWLSPPVNVSNDGKVFNTNPDVVGRSDGSGTRAHIVFETWAGGSDADVRIQHVLAGTAPTGCAATLVLEGGKTVVNKTNVSGVVTPSGCTPTEVQIGVDAPPSTSAARQPYNNGNISAQIPASGTCAPHTVYVRVYTAAGASGLASDQIVVDTTVNASVRAVNPYMSSLPPVYSEIAPTDLAANDGARDGDPRYTRLHIFFLGINDAGDCAGLADFDVQSGAFGSIPAGGFGKPVALPDHGDPTPGQRDIMTVISDTLGTSGTFGPYTLYYDPDKPVLVGGTLTDDQATTSVMRTLTFDNINVTDGQYGTHGESAPFWGVWVANANITATPTITPDSPELNWIPIQVPSPGATFSIQWSLFSGLDYAPDQSHAGQYKVFVRFLDGAGNPTQGVLEDTLTLTAPYTVPQLYAPLIRK